MVYAHILLSSQVAVINGWLLYRRHHSILGKNETEKEMPLIEFHAKIAQDLMMAGKQITSVKKKRKTF